MTSVDYLAYPITANDFHQAGYASRQIKEHLKRIGVDGDAVRRTMIAAYEAEMNVVIHAHGGRLEAALGDGRIEVNVVDNGPGIPDVELALREGYSTASDEARSLGFGAGLGLPNIKRNSDRFRLVSDAEAGTRLSFTVYFTPEEAGAAPRISLYARATLCRDCRRCLTACPTAAMRVRGARPSVLEHLCVDCCACIAVCAPRALTVDGAFTDTDAHEAVAAVPQALLAGFGERVAPDQVVEALKGLGFSAVVTPAAAEAALLAAVVARAQDAAAPRPVISPACPAVTNLVQLRYPALLPHLAPHASPWEALSTSLPSQPATFAVACPAQRTALLSASKSPRTVAADADGPDLALPLPPEHQVVTAASLREALMPAIMGGLATGEPAHPASGPGAVADSADGTAAGVLEVTGIGHVVRVLELIEEGLLHDVPAVELWACDQGCFGAPLLADDGHLARRRWAAGGARAALADTAAPALSRSRPFAPRAGVRLDVDMSRAIEKLALLDATVRALPGKDCGACGAPTCLALAEDVVMERASADTCPYRDRDEVDDHAT